MSTQYLETIEDRRLTIPFPIEDFRGRKMIDIEGVTIGDVDAVLIDNVAQRVRFLRVITGGFLGFGSRMFLVPIEAVKRSDRDQVFISPTRARVLSEPRYRSGIVHDRGAFEPFYRHFGLDPFWSLPDGSLLGTMLD